MGNCSPRWVLCSLFAVGLLSACEDAPTIARPEARLVVDPTLVDFDDVAISARVRVQLALSNPGTVPVDIESAELDESLRGEMELVGVPERVSPGEERYVELYFEPTSVGLREGRLVFRTDSMLTPEVEVNIRGRGVEPALVASPPLVDFGRVVIGQTVTASVTLTNSGDRPVEVLRADLTEGSAEVFSTALERVSLNPGESVVLEARFTPKALELSEGRVTVLDTGARTAALSVRLRGQGVESDIEIEPALLAFTGLYVGQSQTKSFFIRNIGQRAHQIGLLEMAATRTASAGEFALVSTTLPALPLTLGPGESHQVDVTYRPTDAQADTEQVQIESTGLRRTAMVGLTGQAGLAPVARIEVLPPSLVFGQVEVGQVKPLQLRINSVGNADLEITEVLSIEPASAPYSLQNAPVAGHLIPPAAGETVTVVFAPVAQGVVPSAVLVVRTNDPDAPEVQVTLSGEGINAPVPSIFVDPNPLGFGSVPRGVRASRSVMVRNDGSAPLVLGLVRLTNHAGNRFAIPTPPAAGTSLLPGQSTTFAVEYFDNGVVQTYNGVLEVDSNDPGTPVVNVPLSAATDPPPPALTDIAVTLTWSPSGADIDLHLVRPGGRFFKNPEDVCYCNTNPDWGVVGQANDNPFLDRDDLVGPGPEKINLTNSPYNGEYDVVAHYFAQNGHSGPVNATIEVRVRGTLVSTRTMSMNVGERWISGRVNWNTATGMGTFAPHALGSFPTIYASCF